MEKRCRSLSSVSSFVCCHVTEVSQVTLNKSYIKYFTCSLFYPIDNAMKNEVGQMPNDDEKKETVTYRLTRGTIRRLTRITLQLGSNKSSYVERALRAALRRDEGQI